MKKLLPNRWKWEWLSGIIALSINAVVVFILNIDFTISRFTDRAIGSAIVQGVDPKFREPIYYLGFLTFVLVSYLLWWILSKIDHNDNFSLIWFEFGLINIFSIITNFKKLFTDTASENVNILDIQVLSLSLVFIMFIIVFPLFERFIKNKYSIKEMLVLLFVSLSLLITIQVLRGNPYINVLAYRTIIYWLILFIILVLLYTFVFKQSKVVLNAFVFILPLMMLPRLMNEFNLDVIRLIFILAVLFIISIVIKRNDFLSNFHYPVIIISFFIFSYAGQTIELSSLDYLHLGNRVVPAQQFVEFFSIPLVDYWGAQHFNIGSVLFGWLHGVEGLNYLIWLDFENIFYLLIFYGIFKHIFNKHFALLLTLFLPLVGYVYSDQLGLINIYYFGALLPLVLMKYHLNNKSFWSSFWMTILSLVTFVWMPSMGKISIITTIVVLIFSYKTKEDYIKGLSGWGSAILITVFTYVGLLLFKGHSLVDYIVLIKSFAAVDFDIASHANLVGYQIEFWQVLFLYGLAPIMYIVYLLAFFLKKDKNLIDYILVFVSIGSLVSSVRGLARHSLNEDRYHFDFLVLLILCLPVLINQNKKLLNKAIFILISIFFLIFTNIQGVILVNALERGIDTTILNSENRVLINEDIYPEKLVKILNDVLKDDQMFYENVNAHLLYALTNQKAPFLHHAAQMLYNQSAQEVYIQQMDDLYQNEQLPIVIMSGTWWGAFIDQIPTEFSTYKLSEYVYQNYQPWISVNGFELWVANNSDIMETYDLSPLGYIAEVDTRQSAGIGLIPYLWATYDEYYINNNYEIYFEDSSVKPMGTTYDIPVISDKKNGNYVELVIDSNESLNKSAVLRMNEDTFTFTVLPGVHTYAIRVSSQYVWYQDVVNQIQVNGKFDANITSFRILEGD